MLKLKQQQLQTTMRKLETDLQKARSEFDAAQKKFQSYDEVLADYSGVNVPQLAEPAEIKTSQKNVAGVEIPVFKEVSFPQARYSLFATPTWVDKALIDLREVSRCKTYADILQQQFDLLQKELTKIIQRVNLFEKVKIPEAKEIIRIITIKLGDEMTAAVCRAKIAKAKLAEKESPSDRKELEKAAAEG